MCFNVFSDEFCSWDSIQIPKSPCTPLISCNRARKHPTTRFRHRVPCKQPQSLTVVQWRRSSRMPQRQLSLLVFISMSRSALLKAVRDFCIYSSYVLRRKFLSGGAICRRNSDCKLDMEHIYVWTTSCGEKCWFCRSFRSRLLGWIFGLLFRSDSCISWCLAFDYLSSFREILIAWQTLWKCFSF